MIESNFKWIGYDGTLDSSAYFLNSKVEPIKLNLHGFKLGSVLNFVYHKCMINENYSLFNF